MWIKILTNTQFFVLFIIWFASGSQSKLTLPLNWNIRSLPGTECSEDSWKCPEENKCLKLSQLCDGNKDCTKGENENVELLGTNKFCWNKLGRVLIS